MRHLVDTQASDTYDKHTHGVRFLPETPHTEHSLISRLACTQTA